jgi:hypothetical protein
MGWHKIKRQYCLALSFVLDYSRQARAALSNAARRSDTSRMPIPGFILQQTPGQRLGDALEHGRSLIGWSVEQLLCGEFDIFRDRIGRDRQR